MKQQSALWAFIVVIGIGSTLLFLVGFGLGVADVVSPGSVPFAEKPAAKVPDVNQVGELSEINIVSVGDSLTRGTGDETGSGYVRRTMAKLKEVQDKPVTLINNLAVNGLHTDELAERLTNESTGYIIKQANVILLTIGGNDLFQGAVNGLSGLDELDLDTLQAKADEGIASLQRVLTQLREWNSDALIVYVGLYNPFADLKEMYEIGNTVFRNWNNKAAALLNQDSNMLLIPTHDLFEKNIGTYLSSDHFHPNGMGYDAIATRIVQSIPHPQTQ